MVIFSPGHRPTAKFTVSTRSGKALAYFDPKEKYIWSLAAMSDGSLAVGTGESGKIYRVKAANATPEASLLFDTSDSHIITLASDSAGNLYAGTDSNGLVLKFGPDGKPFALLDSPLREIHQLAIGTDGSIYVLAWRFCIRRSNVGTVSCFDAGTENGFGLSSDIDARAAAKKQV